MNAKKSVADARRKADKLGCNKARRHIVMCYDKREADCASKKSMETSWSFLKRRLKELQLAKAVTRIPAQCLDVCKGGPILIVYPEGVWYGGCTPEVIEQILSHHVLGGSIVEEYAIANPPLCADQWKA